MLKLVKQGHTPYKRYWENLVCTFSNFWWWPAALICGDITLIHASLFTLPSPLCLLWVHLSLGWVQWIVHLNSPGSFPHLKIFYLITSVKILFSNKVTFTDSRDYLWTYLSGGQPFSCYMSFFRNSVITKSCFLDKVCIFFPSYFYLGFVVLLWVCFGATFEIGFRNKFILMESSLLLFLLSFWLAI